MPTTETTEAAPTTTEAVEVVEHQIVVGETFTMDSPHYVAHVTVTDVFRPESCGEDLPTYIGIEADVDVESGDGEGRVLQPVGERTEDGDLKENRAISGVTCGDYEEFSAARVRTGEKFEGVLWLQEDVSPTSEIIFESRASAEEPDATEIYVLDLSRFDLAGDAEAAEPTTPETAAETAPTVAPSAAPAPVTGPTFVRCYLADGTALMSDGSHIYMDRCHESASHPNFDSDAARSWSECVIANGHDYCARQFAPAAADAAPEASP